MNTEMWIDPITEEHFAALYKRFHRLTVAVPESKLLACGDAGIGAMALIEIIVDAVEQIKGVETHKGQSNIFEPQKQSRSSRHFDIRYFLFDILQFKRAFVKLMRFCSTVCK
jgi:phosphopantothenoylcysteine synthetase/decarboxylase